MSVRLLTGDCRHVLATLPDASVQCIVTSPPYWGLRDYGHAEQIGLEATPEEYIANLIAVFDAARRVLRDDGTLWLNLGDCYATGAGKVGECPGGGEQGARWRGDTRPSARRDRAPVDPRTQPNRMPQAVLKPKDLVGIPWRVAFALQADGWWLRSDIIWAKPNPMPESIKDRPTKAHEYVFLLAKSRTYFYDAAAAREPYQHGPFGDHARRAVRDEQSAVPGAPPHRGLRRSGNRRRTLADGAPGDRPADHLGRGVPWVEGESGRNLRSVWPIATRPYPEAHFATFPPELARRCIVAGTSESGACACCGAPYARIVDVVGVGRYVVGKGEAKARSGLRTQFSGGERNGPIINTRGWRPTCGCGAATTPCVVLDPFGGAGTVGRVAEDLGRDSILIELNPTYVAMAKRRCAQRGLFASREEATA